MTSSAKRLARAVFKLRHWFVLGVAAAASGVLMSGCTRTYYRRQADCVVSDAVAGATANPRFLLPGHSVDIDPRSRLFDPTDPDRPPMPPDDPDSHRLMVCVDGHRGWPHWEKDGVLPDVEVNDYKSWLPYDTDGKVRLDLRETIKLARLHSRDYQLQLETLYFSALDVTAERFAFNVQFFGGNTTQYTAIPPILNGGSRTSLLSTNTNLQANRLFTAGGQLIVNAANSIVWQFSGNQTTVNTNLLNFAFSQPLLQFAGRPRIMETLTRSERNLLFNVRQYERYRQGFYIGLATGNASNSSLQRAGGIVGGSGLTGFTGVGVGGFGGIGAVSSFAGAAAAGGGAIAPGGAGGYLYFLQTRHQLRNLKARNSRLRDTWLQLSASFDAGRLENRFQVDFARQAYYDAQSQLINQTANFESFFDAYKTQQLGLPPDIPMDIQDPFFDRFNLIDPELTQLEEDVGDRLEDLSLAQVENSAVAKSRLHDLPNRVRTLIAEVGDDLNRIEEQLPQRREALKNLANYPELKDNQFDLRALTVEALDERAATLKRDHLRLTDELIGLSTKVTGLQHETDLDAEVLLRAEKEVLVRLSGSLLELSLVQARARLNAIAIMPLSMTSETMFQVAMSQRADWMNAKAQLVDSWRLIRFNANALRSNVTVNVTGGVTAQGSTASNPVRFSGTDGQLQAGLTINPPLTRVIQRNVFRESLIEYQQSRRALMLSRDEIHRSLRLRLRQARLDQLNLELRRMSVDVAITQTDVARLKLVEPEKPSADGKISAASPTVARDLVDALQRLLDAQQQFMFTWGDYEIQRRLIDFEMGTMRLDDDGLWVDPGPMTDELLLERYYECRPDPVGNEPLENRPGFAELAPGDLPPEGRDLDLPSPDDVTLPMSPGPVH